MSFLSAAERFSALDRSEIVLDADRCLHAHDQSSTCDACYEICPAEAIRPGQPPALDSGKCQSCLACLPVCPVGAFSADDAVRSLLTCVARLESTAMELVCAGHAAGDTGVSPKHTGIRVRGCLAGLGTGTYLALIALGMEQVVVRLDACEGCPWASLQTVVRSQVEGARQWLTRWDKSGTLVELTELEAPLERPLWDADNPPLSRRDLFRLAAKQGGITMARAFSAESSGDQRQPGRDRLRLIRAISHLPEPAAHLEEPLASSGFVTLSISESCSACETCARACPTGALTFQTNVKKTHYELYFTARTCIGCDVCTHVCAPEAIEIDRSPAFAQVFGDSEPRLLREGELSRCPHCRTYFASNGDEKLCPVCAYRQKHPFGSMLPPGVRTIKKRKRP